MSACIDRTRAAARLGLFAFVAAFLAWAAPAAAQPRAVHANPTNANVTLTWTAAPGATSYRVYMATATGVSPTSTGLPGFMSHTGIVGTSFTHPTPLANGTTYYFVVTSFDGAVESTPSLEVASRPSATVDAAKAGVLTMVTQFAGTVNAQGANLTAADLAPYYDAAYRNDGWTAAIESKRLANDVRGGPIDSFVIESVDFYDEANQVISVGGTLTAFGQSIFIDGRTDGALLIFRSTDGGTTWKCYGNQRNARPTFQVEMRMNRAMNATTGPAQHVNFDVEAPVTTMSSVSVTGPGLASPRVILPAATRLENIEGEPGVFTTVQKDAAFDGFDPAVTIPRGATYTFAFTRTPAAGGGTQSYPETFTGTAVTDPVGGAVYITSPTGFSLAHATLGSTLPVTWTLPTAYVATAVNLDGYVQASSGGYQCFLPGAAVAPGATSGTITLPTTCNGIGISSAGISVTATGADGERSYTTHQFAGIGPSPLALPPATITLDGATGDWAGIAALTMDPLGDMLPDYSGSTMAGSDIKGLYAAMDATYLYLRLDLFGNFNATFGNGPPPNRGSYRFRVESDSATYPILQLGVAYGVYGGQPFPGQWNVGYNGSNGLAPPSLNGPGFVAVGTDVLEMRIPRALIGNPANIFRISAQVNDCCTGTGGFNVLDEAALGGSADVAPPTVPTGLVAVLANPSQVNLSWTGSTDNVGIARYVVYRNGVPIASPDVVSGTAWVDGGLPPGTFTYRVAACDAAGNCSASSDPASATALDAAADADGDGIPNGVEFTEGRNPLVKDNDIFTSNRLFAMQQYRDFLGREGDAGGVTFYTDLLTNGPAVRANVIESFFNSPEFAGTVSPIVRLYFATFLRIPDFGGLQFQVNAYRTGTPLTVIANNFSLSPEFQSRYGALTNSQYVTLLYQNVLNRTPVQAEVDFHVARLVSGVTRGEVMVGFSESPEYQGGTYSNVYVTMMYVGMLGRAPEQAGFDFWVNYMNTGNPGINLILGFLNAPEYHNRFLP